MADFEKEYKRVWAVLNDVADRQDKSAANLARIEEIVENNSKQLGDFTNSYGEAIEREFVAALEEAKRIGNIVFEKVECRLRRTYEYDIVAKSGKVVAVGEIKHKLKKEDVLHFAAERLPHFAELFPDIARGRKVIGMVGGGMITPDAAREAKKRGLIVLRLENKKIIAENAASPRPIPQV